ncbi:MAG TPA: hypothetical protein VFC63_19385 [Blastocatellia bacterium]|nr:hypothetical protein [Blastocatellia bacterium]
MEIMSVCLGLAILFGVAYLISINRNKESTALEVRRPGALSRHPRELYVQSKQDQSGVASLVRYRSQKPIYGFQFYQRWGDENFFAFQTKDDPED